MLTGDLIVFVVDAVLLLLLLLITTVGLDLLPALLPLAELLAPDFPLAELLPDFPLAELPLFPILPLVDELLTADLPLEDEFVDLPLVELLFALPLLAVELFLLLVLLAPAE